MEKNAKSSARKGTPKMTLREYENTTADKKADKAALAKINAKRKGKGA